MMWVVDSEVVIHDVFSCLLSNSSFSADGVYSSPYFVQPVLEIRVMATSAAVVVGVVVEQSYALAV